MGKVNEGGVTDLHKNSRYPGLARAVLFPILLLVVCKKKETTIISLCARDGVYRSLFSRIPYGARQSLSPIHKELV